MDNVEEYMDVDQLVDVACTDCGIPSFRMSMSDEDIAKVCRWVGEYAPGSGVIDGKMCISAEGFDAMLFITIIEFPDFFNRYNLAMVWRN